MSITDPSLRLKFWSTDPRIKYTSYVSVDIWMSLYHRLYITIPSWKTWISSAEWYIWIILFIFSQKVNLDVTAMIALVSSMTNGSCHFQFEVKMLARYIIVVTVCAFHELANAQNRNSNLLCIWGIVGKQV